MPKRANGEAELSVIKRTTDRGEFMNYGMRS